MVKISDLNRKERGVRQSLGALERQFRNNKISKIDYNKAKSEKEGELKRIGSERKSIITKLPPIPPPPKPSKAVTTVKPPGTVSGTASSDLKQMIVELKKQGKDLLFTQSEMSKLFGEVVKNRERVKRIEDVVREVGSAKARVPEVDTKAIDEMVSSQIEKMDAAMMESTRKSREELDRMAGDVRNLRTEIEDVKKLRDDMNKMDISGLRRDLESLKERSKWLEQQIENLDIEPLYELIKEIESRVSSTTISTSPVIIE